MDLYINTYNVLTNAEATFNLSPRTQTVIKIFENHLTPVKLVSILDIQLELTVNLSLISS